SILSLYVPQEVSDPTQPGLKATIYTAISMPVLLLASITLATRVARTYERELRRAFVFIAAYLTLLAIGNLKLLSPTIYGWSQYAPLIFDLLASSMLLLSCYYTLKVVQVRTMKRVEWLILAGIFAGSVLVVIANTSIDAAALEPVKQQYLAELQALADQAARLKAQGAPEVEVLKAENALLKKKPEIDAFVASIDFAITRSLAFGILNFALINTLIPVLFLYLHQFRGEARESLTFLMLILGIIVATVADWLFALAAGIPHHQLANFWQAGSPYDVIILIAYYTIFLGLFVHVNYEKWSLKNLKNFKLE
ncbi:MAG: hypothetical protein HY558_03905, partial [Euryarchaeota archaeon]|nr:hypothetical protein [Euryarchaeota archaeon]